MPLGSKLTIKERKMDTTTSDEGAPVAQPQASEAEAAAVQDQGASTNNDQASESTADSSKQEPVAQAESQADDDDVQAWAEKKGLPLDDPVKLAKMYRDAEKKMHEATNQVHKTPIEPPELLEPSGDVNYDQLVERQNVQEQRIYVRDWFEANPDMKEHRAELTRISAERPWLTNLDDVRAHFLASPQRLKDVKTEGGREALTNLAQKQQQIPPSAGATNSGVYESNNITPQNVYQLVDKNGPEWFQKNYAAINEAIQQRG